ncbi:hypothetical protein [Pseudonocardia sp. MH-G8]|uniref:hypothetical protein n=1 Tax=Pseudonocardia sp. MH-G8 TaxID=1854588 RepID=UPI000BA04940|nr:hypothetical protein [Pseudonocardia sp. MH-G8]OZM79155.1 hypothetical protein CFP66_27965 [Pseudonocardia sp. MH-G8]
MQAPETYNPWTIVHVVFDHLAADGLHPVLGETGDPAEPATALLRALGIEPGREREGPAAESVQATLAEMRARMFPDVGNEP